MMDCLFCGLPEIGYGPGPEKEFICSKCIQILLLADQEELNRAHIKAIEMGCSGKAKAIESFLIPEETNVREAKITKRNMARKRALRSFRPARDQLRTQPAAI